MTKQKISFIIFFLFLITHVDSQVGKKVTLKSAEKLFDKGQFDKAADAYKALLFSNDKDPNLNYKLGICLLKIVEDKSEAIPYLKIGLADKAGKAALEPTFMLATAYHQSYRFDEAIRQYQILQQSKYRKLLIGVDLELLIEQCNTGKKLTENPIHLQVFGIKSVKKADFFNRSIIGYERTDSSQQKVVPKPKSLKTEEELKVKDQLLLLQIENGKYSMYPEFKYNKKGRLDKDIVYEKAVEDEIFGERLDIGPLINTEYDEDFPYLNSKNKVLYFTHNGPGSMGGYDIFFSEWDSVTGYWGAPQNMGFPINSVFDEFLFIPNQQDKFVYFSSNRHGSADFLNIYQTLPPIKHTNHVVFAIETKEEYKKIEKVKIYSGKDGKAIGNYASLNSMKKLTFSLPELNSYVLEMSLDNGEIVKDYLYVPCKTRMEKVNYLSLQKHGNLVHLILINDSLASAKTNAKVHSNLSNLMVNYPESLRLSAFSNSIEESIFYPWTKNIIDSIKQETIQNKLLDELLFADYTKFDCKNLQFKLDTLNRPKGNKGNDIGGELISFSPNNKENNSANEFNQKVTELTRQIEMAFNEGVLALSDAQLYREILELSSVAKDSSNQKMDSILTVKKIMFDGVVSKIENKNSSNKKVLEEVNKLLENTKANKISIIELQGQKAFLIDDKRIYNELILSTWKKKKKRAYAKEISEIDKKISFIDAKVQALENQQVKTEQEKMELSSILFAQNPLYEVISTKSFDGSLKFRDIASDSTVRKWIQEKEGNNLLWYTYANKKSKEKKQISSKEVNYLSQVAVLPTLKKDAIEEEKEVTIVDKPKEIVKKRTQNLPVEKGMSLSILARKYKVSVADIKKINAKSAENPKGIDWSEAKRQEPTKDWIYEGEQILVPDTTSNVKVNRESFVQTKRKFGTYEVQKTDNLYSVARKHNISVKLLKEINTKSSEYPNGIDWSDAKRIDPTSDWIYVGEILRVP